jgi:hypothetical protein
LWNVTDKRVWVKYKYSTYKSKNRISMYVGKAVEWSAVLYVGEVHSGSGGPGEEVRPPF